MAAVHDLALVRENCSSGILLTPDAPAVVGPVAELLQADRLERAFSVPAAGLDRYLSKEATGGRLANLTAAPGADGKEESAGTQRWKIEWPRYQDRTRRQGDEASTRSCRRYPRHNRSGHFWDHD